MNALHLKWGWWKLAGAAFGLLALAPGIARAQEFKIDARTPDPETVIKKVGLTQNLDHRIPMDLVFQDETGKTVKLADYFGKKPVLLNLIQYRCQMLCSEEMRVLAESLKELKFTAGKEFTLLTVTIDPREKPDLAAEYKKGYMADYARPEAAEGWHFLTGDEATINRLAEAVGYRYVYDARKDAFAHPDGVLVLTPQGKIARYFFHLEYPPSALRMGIVEASQGKIGTIVDQIALLCYHYDPVTGKYGLAVLGLVRLGGLAIVLMLCLGIVVMKWRDRGRHPLEEAAVQIEAAQHEGGR